MKTALTVADRVTLISVLRSVKSEDLNLLLDIRDKTKSFQLDDQEKIKVGYKENKAIGTATWDDEEYQVEFELSKGVVRNYIDRVKELAKEKAITAGLENVLALYEKLNNLSDEPVKS